VPLASRAIGSKPIAMRLPVRVAFKMNMFPYGSGFERLRICCEKSLS
jgi:hypothetical protein